MTTTMSNLPKDLVHEIVSRVPMKYMRAVRLTCKNWNALFESRSLKKTHIDKEEEASRELGETRILGMMDYNVYLTGITVNDNPTIEPLALGKLTCLDEQVKIYQVFHCEGLLLCILKDDDTKIVVCNPYLGQTRWIHTRTYYPKSKWKGRYVYNYAFGYKTNSPKILRFMDDFSFNIKNSALVYELYDFDTDLWTTLDVAPNWRTIVPHAGLSIKGNTYWCAIEQEEYETIDQIICFDFTRERFGPLLPLPVTAGSHVRFASLSSVREEKIGALFRTRDTTFLQVDIWITTKIDALNVSWSHFFTVNMPSYLGRMFFCTTFFIDEEKKVAVIFKIDKILGNTHISFIGEAGCLRKLEVGEYADKTCWPRVCSYVPSIVQIKQT
ncbi:PREDICTED: LOW QUALITY PROTEIN: putative F-box protein At4g10740 [Camelina sativa]|uniref:LOW QUALITY PROTEIN: putative F-box protein At4g10740 n=1 Tax=Camelina sativa TaxID=90675 RepID=A0ABM1QNE7_CAMSA|nr:PREDICTED: LOW QUALITY PROTEIN: putative F-box protein At4g10740 [Camelina sativa]